jgi:hypothetical protein
MSNFLDDRHALFCGWVIGSLLRQHQLVKPEFLPSPVTNDSGDYLPRVRFIADDPAQSFELVIPEPPEAWHL